MAPLGRANLDVHRLSLALAAPGEPRGHGFREAFGFYAGTGFEEALGNRKRVVKLRLAGEVAHTEIVKPIEGAGAPLGTHHDFDAELVSEHESSITGGSWDKGTSRTANFLPLPNERTRIKFVPGRSAWQAAWRAQQLSRILGSPDDLFFRALRAGRREDLS